MLPSRFLRSGAADAAGPCSRLQVCLVYVTHVSGQGSALPDLPGLAVDAQHIQARLDAGRSPGSRLFLLARYALDVLIEHLAAHLRGVGDVVPRDLSLRVERYARRRSHRRF